MRRAPLFGIALCLLSCGDKKNTAPQPTPPTPTPSAETKPATMAETKPAVVEPKVEAKQLTATAMQGPFPAKGGYCAELKKAKSGQESSLCDTTGETSLYQGAWQAAAPAAPYTRASALVFHLEDTAPESLHFLIEANDSDFGVELTNMMPMMMDAAGGDTTYAKGLSIELKDIVAGGAPEIIYRYQLIDVSNYTRIMTSQIEEVLLCGLGASGKPSCTTPIPVSAAYWSSDGGDEKAPDSASTWTAALSFVPNGVQIAAPELKRQEVEVSVPTLDDGDEPGGSIKVVKETESARMKSEQARVEKLIGTWALVFP